MNDAPPDRINVEVVYALPNLQRLIALQLEPASNVADAVRASGLCAEFPEIDPETSSLGVWGHPVQATHSLKDGDRVEIYRPLAMDPREARRQLALHGKAMGGRPA